MPVSTPPIGLLAARSVFGLGAGGLLELLRAPGGIIPSIPANSAVPQAAPIGMLDLGNATAQSVTLAAASASGAAASPQNAQASLQINPDGFVKRTEQGSTTNAYQWLLTGSSANYDIMAVLASGDTPSGTLNTWLNCASAQTWGHNLNTNGARNTTLTMSIRPAGGGATLATNTWTLHVEREPGA